MPQWSPKVTQSEKTDTTSPPKVQLRHQNVPQDGKKHAHIDTNNQPTNQQNKQQKTNKQTTTQTHNTSKQTIKQTNTHTSYKTHKTQTHKLFEVQAGSNRFELQRKKLPRPGARRRRRGSHLGVSWHDLAACWELITCLCVQIW